MDNAMITPNNFNKQDKNNKIKQLIEYLRISDYIPIDEQRSICKQFGVRYSSKYFREEYSQRFFDYVFHTPTSVAMVEYKTSIPQKYLTVCKLKYEKKKQLKVIRLDQCPYTGSKGVQIVTTNPKYWQENNSQS